MNRPQSQITQYFNRFREVFLPCFNPLWELRACRRWPVGSPPAHGPKVTWCKPVFSMSQPDRPLHLSGLESPLQLPSNALLTAGVSYCLLTKRVPSLAPGHSPRRPGPCCQLSHRHRTISSAEDLAISQVSDHKLCSHLPAPKASELAQVLANFFHTFFLVATGGPRGELLSHVWQRRANVFVPFSEHWAGGWLLHLHNFSLYFLDCPAPSWWMENGLFSGRKALC